MRTSIYLVLSLSALLATSCAPSAVSGSQLGHDASLSFLQVQGQTLSPAFSSSSYSYTVAVENAVTSVSINATAADVKSSVSFNPSATPTLSVGQNTIFVTVVSEDQSVTESYTLDITRASPTVQTPTAKFNDDFSGDLSKWNLIQQTGSASASVASGILTFSMDQTSGLASSSAILLPLFNASFQGVGTDYSVYCDLLNDLFQSSNSCLPWYGVVFNYVDASNYGIVKVNPGAGSYYIGYVKAGVYYSPNGGNFPNALPGALGVSLSSYNNQVLVKVYWDGTEISNYDAWYPLPISPVASANAGLFISNALNSATQYSFGFDNFSIQ